MDTADRRFRRTGAGFDYAVKNGKHTHRIRYGNMRIGRTNRRTDSNEPDRAQRCKHLSFHFAAAFYRPRRINASFYCAAAENWLD